MSALEPVRAYLTSEPVRRALRYSARTFVYAFLGVLVPGLLGFLHAVTAWAEEAGQEPFPSATGLAYLGVSAVTAGTIAVVNLVGRLLEDGFHVKPLRREE